MPHSNVEFWEEKIRRNKERDSREIAELEGLGWNVIVVWECELAPKEREATLQRLAETLRQNIEPESIHAIPLSVRKLSLNE